MKKHALSLMFLLEISIGLSSIARLSTEPSRPFFWKDGLRKGEVFQDSRIPYRFTAPEVVIFRIWNEGSFFRFEARSYSDESVQIAITSMRNIRSINPVALRSDLDDGCLPDTVRSLETDGLLMIECMHRPTASEQPHYLIRRLDKPPSQPDLLFFFEIRSLVPVSIDDLNLQLTPAD